MSEQDALAQLDRLVERFLDAEEQGRSFDIEQQGRLHKGVRAELTRFIVEHRRFKRATHTATSTWMYPGPHPSEDVYDSQNESEGIQAGEVIGQCQVLQELGRGGMGVVYLAKHVRLQNERAIKVLPRNRVTSEMIHRFKREAQTAASINHLNVVVIHDVGVDNDRHFIEMQYVDGRNLSQFLDHHLLQSQGQPLEWQSVFQLARPMLDALSAMHAKGLIHRDIKPNNIMLSESMSRDRHVVLMDFGLVHDAGMSSITEQGVVMGTPAYMPREQARGSTVDARSDIYALGATLYYLLAGRPPFSGSAQELFHLARAGTKPTPLVRLRTDLPFEVIKVIEKSMELDPNERYQRAVEMMGAVSDVLQIHGAKLIEQAPDESRPSGERTTAPLSISETETRGQEITTEDPPSGNFMPFVAATPPPPPLPTASSTGEWFRQRITTPWALGSIGALIALGFVVLAFLAFGNNGDPDQGVADQGDDRNASTNDADEDSASDQDDDLSTSDSNSSVSTDRFTNMIHIDAGQVTIGNSDQVLRVYAKSLPDVASGVATTDDFLSFFEDMTHGQHTVEAFWIDKYEVSNHDYLQFVNDSGHAPPSHWIDRKPLPGTERYPVINVSYYDADAYARWAGKRLPTVKQWVRAFRGDTEDLFPWGNEWLPQRTNTGSILEPDRVAQLFPIDQTPEDVSPFGVFNLVGNAGEITRDLVIEQGDQYAIVKGASPEDRGDLSGLAAWDNYTNPSFPTSMFTGFRCVIEDSRE